MRLRCGILNSLYMSLIITICTHEGIVMASDSCGTRYFKDNIGGFTKHSNSINKLFLINNTGVSVCGTGCLNGGNIVAKINKYIEDYKDCDLSIEQIIDDLNDMANEIDECKVFFHVCGYQSFRKYIHVFENSKEYQQLIDVGNYQGVKCCGVTNTISKLIQETAHKEADGTYRDFPLNPPLYSNFTLQDAIDFAHFLIYATIQMNRFTKNDDNVSYPIDILVLKPNEAIWVKRKELCYPPEIPGVILNI